MASPFKQKSKGKTPPKKDPPKQTAKEKRVVELANEDVASKAKGKPKHAGDVHKTNVGMKPVNVDKAAGGPAKRAIANMIAGRTTHAKAKGALNINTGEETDSLYS